MGDRQVHIRQKERYSLISRKEVRYIMDNVPSVATVRLLLTGAVLFSELTTYERDTMLRRNGTSFYFDGDLIKIRDYTSSEVWSYLTESEIVLGLAWQLFYMGVFSEIPENKYTMNFYAILKGILNDRSKARGSLMVRSCGDISPQEMELVTVWLFAGVTQYKGTSIEDYFAVHGKDFFKNITLESMESNLSVMEQGNMLLRSLESGSDEEIIAYVESLY